MDIFNHPSKRLGSAPNLLQYAQACAHLPGLALLESRKGAVDSRYDMLAASPRATFKLESYNGDLSGWMDAIEDALCQGKSSARAGGIAIGFLDYDNAARCGSTGLKSTLHNTKSAATCSVYDWCLVRDRLNTSVTLYFSPQLTSAERQKIASQLVTHSNRTLTFNLDSRFHQEISREQYLCDINRIRNYIAAGDCYQVNYAQRFSAPFSGDPLAAYLSLRDVAPGDFSAFLALRSNQSVVSLSPERFLSVANRHVVTQPIKGTRPRHPDPDQDRIIAEQLKLSAKDRAENVMITDLLRNDLGRMCRPGTVATTELCQLYSYENVHHLASKVEGQLRAGVSAGQLLISCSPGGSITGAPKRRAMEIIAELEQQPRGIYCGSVFAMDGSGWLESSIAIRTLEVLDGRISCWGGGGITFDSDGESEYRETFDKVAAFMRALEAASALS